MVIKNYYKKLTFVEAGAGAVHGAASSEPAPTKKERLRLCNNGGTAGHNAAGHGAVSRGTAGHNTSGYGAVDRGTSGRIAAGHSATNLLFY